VSIQKPPLGLSPPQKHRSLFFKTVFLSWGLTILTVTLFIAFLLPVSHTILLENLRTLGDTLASSISQVAISAIIAEDYSPMIDHCLKIIEDRPPIKFIVVTRNDGFSLIVTPNAWRRDTLDAHWRDNSMAEIGTFEMNSLGGEEVFRFGLPLIYWGVHWGRLHIGLSLDGYKAFRRKISAFVLFAALLTTLAGLVVSYYFSHRLSRPIQLLEEFVKQVGSGDFSARVEIDSMDEVESLAQSFNQMSADLCQSRKESRAAQDYSTGIIRNITDPLLVFSHDGGITPINDAVPLLTGWTADELMGKTCEVLFPQAESKDFREAWNRLGKEGVVQDFRTTMARKNGPSIPVLFSGATMKNTQGEFSGMVVIAKDITERNRVEEEIAQSLAEKGLLLKEIHHRVKNNMQVISSLLRLQASTIEDKAVVDIFQTSQNRIRTMALIHEMLYRSKDLSRIDISEYIHEMVESLVRTGKDKRQQIDLEIRSDPILIEIETAIPCGLILNEVVSNSLKHAFPNGRSGKISILVQKGNEEIIHLTISDNGVGFAKGVDHEKKGTLGLELISTLLTGQLKGEMNVCRENGAEYRFSFTPKTMWHTERKVA